MRIVVVGPGALGTLFAALLAPVTTDGLYLLDYRRQRAQALAKSGIFLEHEEVRRRLAVKVVSDPHDLVGVVDLIVLCVKALAVPEALKFVRPLATGKNLLVALQNGIGHHEELRHSYPGAWALGVTTQGATLVRPGVVRHAGEGPTYLGFLPETRQLHPLLGEVVRLFNHAGIAAEASADIQRRVWGKLLINAGINALTVIYDCANGRLLEIPRARERMRRAVSEAHALGRALGVRLPDNYISQVERVCLATGANISSMLQDVRRGRETEIMAINGALLRLGAKLGIALPENEALVREVQGLQRELPFVDRY